MHEIFVHGSDDILTSTQPVYPPHEQWRWRPIMLWILAPLSSVSLDLAQIMGSVADTSNGQPHVCFC